MEAVGLLGIAARESALSMIECLRYKFYNLAKQFAKTFPAKYSEHFARAKVSTFTNTK